MYKCDHCHKEFTNERTTIKHVCEPKRRFLQRGDRYVMIAFCAFKLFYNSMKMERTIDEFDKSSYYTAFTKFGRYCLNSRNIDPEAYSLWLIKNEVKLSDWIRDDVYALWIKDYIRSENIDLAVKRSLEHMQLWADNNQRFLSEYFQEISLNLFVNDIFNGRISPWLILNSNSGLSTLGRLNDEQLIYINNIIDPQYWSMKFKRLPDDVEYVKNVITMAQL